MIWVAIIAGYLLVGIIIAAMSGDEDSKPEHMFLKAISWPILVSLVLLIAVALIIGLAASALNKGMRKWIAAKKNKV